MYICFVSPRFHPIIGGVETYLKNIAAHCSKFMNISVITSNLKNPIHIFEKRHYIKKRYDFIYNKVTIIRSNTLKNPILKIPFYFNDYLNKKLEILFDFLLNPFLYNRKTKIPQKLSTNINKFLFYQRIFTNPNFLQIYNILKKIHLYEKIDIVHSAPIYLTSNIYAVQFSNKNHVPFICTPFYHINPYTEKIFYPSFQYILKKSNAVIACTLLEKEFYQRYGIDGDKIHIIPPGIDINQYKKSNIEKFKQKYNIPNKCPLLLFLGRRTYEKGFPQLILALKILIRKFKNIKLLIAGAVTRDFQLFFKDLPNELKNHIIDLGLIDDQGKISAFSICDVFVLPSLDDAFGIVYLEAWLFKKPVIGVLEGNVAGLIDDNVNGFLVPFNDIKTLSFKIEILLKDKNKRDEFGRNGHHKLMSNYVLDIVNRKILDLYKTYL